MDPKQLFIDERLKGICVYCGAKPSTRDHVPSRVLLDKPYPNNLSVVESCSQCNNGFSSDEEYIACFIECVIHGTTDLNESFRENIANILLARPLIKTRIEKAKSIDQKHNVIWAPEIKRFRNVVLKLARGHIHYELGVLHLEAPVILDMLPIPLLSEKQWLEFNSNEEGLGIWPEIGSRAFINLCKEKPTAYDSWNIVQDNIYRYTVNQSRGDQVKLVISEYLACRVVWDG